jgi:hypothetical protein
MTSAEERRRKKRQAAAIKQSLEVVDCHQHTDRVGEPLVLK